MEEASVAGESPDRSKQRESSAEPTSGSAGSVPEARDPRLAVSREKDSSGGVTDTATKVLTVRPETPAEPKKPAGTENSATPGEDTALRAAVSAWVRKPGTDATAKSGKTEVTSNAAGEPGSSSDGEAGAEGPSDGPAETGASSDAETTRGASSDTDAATTSKAGVKAKAEGSAAKAAEAKPGAAGKGDASAGNKAAADPKSETGTGGKTGDAAAKGDPAGKTGTAAKADAGAEASASAKAGAGAKASAGAGDKADQAAKADADPKSKTDTGAKTGAGAKGDAGGESKAAPGAGAGAGVRAAAEAGAAPGGDGPVVADGGDGPQGPPAGDDESRTGGAGGKTGAADGEAEAEPEPQTDAVDQPTTVFKAVQPEKPGVDQPTTMLKLGGKPTPKTESESESERTSKFVALRDDLRTPGKTPAPVPDATTPVPQVGPERTTQQPLPPKPPLDLLAELTNTPPPPETPVRTIVRRVKIWTPLVLLLVIIFAVVQAFRPLPAPTLALTAKDSYTFDGRTDLPWPGEGQGWIDGDGIGTMGRFGKQTPVAIGSVAKTMTAYIILKEHPLKPGQEGPNIKVDPKAEKEGGYDKDGESTLNTVKAGDHLTEKQALSAVMIPSANNIARLLARWDAGSEAAFVKKMNATARELGMTGTTYTDPSGLKETTVSTAKDQVKLGRAVVKVPALVAITSAASWTDPSGHNWPNYNELPYRIGAIGIKTGSTTAAGGNLLFASRKKVGGQTVTVVGAILGQNKAPILGTANTVSKTALLAAQDALTSAKILKKGDVVGYVDDRLGGHTPIVVTEDVSAVGWAGLKARLSFTSGAVPHTAKAGTQVGTLTVGDGTPGAVKVPVALQKDLSEPGFGAKLTRVS
ncbi:D-alanyl-D-alanine carboxypeptidase [Streptomyces sp. NPDC042638]|uniref:D-alanyl-D-alanine carboxypeptidase n=1 Tax=Streptomyces sp. NPDC042638 TaxID=3154333 RepID=UPI0033D0141F